jgi:hypothetical protein
MTDSPPSAAPPAPLTDAERAWLQARAAELGVDAGAAYAGPLSAGADGRIVLSTDASSSALKPLAGEGGAAFLAEQAHLGAGETLVITSPRREPVHVVLGRLTVAEGGRVGVETPVELWAATAALAPGSVVELIGEAGRGGYPGIDGDPGSDRSRTGGVGDTGEPGGRGEDGPGGMVWFAEVRGTLTVVAGGGSGGAGGKGGTGGRGLARGPSAGVGGNGGVGGRGGDAGNGGSVVIALGTMAPGTAIHPRARPGAPGPGGGAGDPGQGETGQGGAGPIPGHRGTAGPPGNLGDAPDFVIRYRGDA